MSSTDYCPGVDGAPGWVELVVLCMMAGKASLVYRQLDPLSGMV